MSEGASKICGPIPPDPSLFPQYYRRPSSARGRLEGNCNGTSALFMGPLAPDPVLFPGYYSGHTPAHRPRINPDATHILERGKKGVVGDLIKLQGVSKSPVPSPKPRPFDFSKENKRRLREIQKRCKEQEAERAQSRPVPVKAMWMSPKYQDVPSRVMAQLEVSDPPIKPQCQNFLKAHSNGGSAGPQRPLGVAVQRPASCIPTHNQDLKTINFIKHNALAAGKTVIRRSQSLTNLRDKPVPCAVKGQVPQYLQERKVQWCKEKEERERNAPDPTVPPGHTRMPDSEREGTLKTLKDTHRTLVTELLSLPLKADSPSFRSRRAHLDCRLSEIEEAIKIFSRDRVYIKNDS
ncbi:enkurin domain-containing protein 1 [Cololabis saira]|uniref:enkurin domain-containing protein 1 n=1 Tax=Cololabis saira TaxID=129043 RepID=UPI002AD2A7DE|nr:enkurin domain-containing protein 1 [Cololabis saira]